MNDFLRCSSSKSNDQDFSVVEEQYEGSVLQGFQSREHEFYAARSHDIMPRTAEELEGEGNGVDVNGGKKSRAKEEEKEQLEKYERLSSVSLRSVMQSNVPEPFNPHGRNPTHLNMPGGGVKLQEKYLSGNLQKVHPSRQFSTSIQLRTQAAEMPEQASYTDLPCPQGVQGYDCIRFKLWLQNCQRHDLNCDQMIEDFETGRKTLAQIFEEQEQIIREVAQAYRGSVAGDLAGHEGLQSVDFARVDSDLTPGDPCVQGVQGSDCNNFRLWLSNCLSSSSNAGDCDKQLEAYSSGRKTLSQIFEEQEKQISSVYQQQRRHYSTSSKGSNEVSGQSDPNPEATLTQRQKLKRAAKEYGATVMVFHISVALTSLGCWYLLVSRFVFAFRLLSFVSFLKRMGLSIYDSRASDHCRPTPLKVTSVFALIRTENLFRLSIIFSNNNFLCKTSSTVFQHYDNIGVQIPR